MPRVAKYKLYQANRVHNQKFDEHKYSVLRQRIENMKPSVDNGMPEGYWRAHENRSKRSARMEQNTLIAKTNQKLYARLDHIAHKKSNIGKNEYYIPASKRRNPYREQRIVSVRQIYRENKLLCQRLKEIMESPGESITAAHGEHPGSCPCGQTVVSAMPLKKKEEGKAEETTGTTSNSNNNNTDNSPTTTTTTTSPSKTNAPAKLEEVKQPTEDTKPSTSPATASPSSPAASSTNANSDQPLICARCGCKVTPVVDTLHEKEKKRLKQTFQIYTNGVKAELDHYQLIKQEEKKHHLLHLKKMLQKKKKLAGYEEDYEDDDSSNNNTTSTTANDQEGKNNADKTKAAPIKPHHVDHLTSAFANFSLTFNKK